MLIESSRRALQRNLLKGRPCRYPRFLPKILGRLVTPLGLIWLGQCQTASRGTQHPGIMGPLKVTSRLGPCGYLTSKNVNVHRDENEVVRND